MPVMPINLYGDKILRKKVQLIKDIDIELVGQIKNMFLTMRKARGMGLAANQVGLDKSLFVMDISCIEGFEKIKPIAMINPKITYLSEEKIYLDEGCLSIPDLRGDVERPEKIQVIYYDLDMKEISLEADDWFARVIQHEYDHLQGICFTDKLDAEDQKIIKRELKRITSRKIDVNYPVTPKER
jgi:peptide deformylase